MKNNEKIISQANSSQSNLTETDQDEQELKQKMHLFKRHLTQGTKFAKKNQNQIEINSKNYDLKSKLCQSECKMSFSSSQTSILQSLKDKDSDNNEVDTSSYDSVNSNSSSSSLSDSLTINTRNQFSSLDKQVLGFDSYTEDNFCVRNFKFVDKKKLCGANLKNLYLKTNDIICGKYLVMQLIGEGTFSKVFKCFDLKHKQYVALKWLKKRNQFSLFQTEVKIAKHLNERDEEQNYNFVRILDCFEFCKFFFIVYEQLGCNLNNYLLINNLKNFTLDQVRDIGYQMCQALDFMHRNHVIHTDIKPENVLFVHFDAFKFKNTKIKIVDFGCSYIFSELNTGTVTTKNYRSPEVILKIPWSYPIDVWSVACTLFEIYFNNYLFKYIESDAEHIFNMYCVLGTFPKWMQKVKPNCFYNSSSKFQNIKLKQFKLENYFSSDQDEDQFCCLLKKMLIYDPDKRPTMSELRFEPFFKKSK